MQSIFPILLQPLCKITPFHVYPLEHNILKSMSNKYSTGLECKSLHSQALVTNLRPQDHAMFQRFVNIAQYCRSIQIQTMPLGDRHCNSCTV